MSPSAAAGEGNLLPNSSPVALEAQRILKAPSCGHFTKKHHFIVDSYYSGKFAVMKCHWTLCQQRKVVPHVVIQHLTVAR